MRNEFINYDMFTQNVIPRLHFKHREHIRMFIFGWSFWKDLWHWIATGGMRVRALLDGVWSWNLVKMIHSWVLQICKVCFKLLLEISELAHHNLRSQSQKGQPKRNILISLPDLRSSGILLVSHEICRGFFVQRVSSICIGPLHF